MTKEEKIADAKYRLHALEAEFENASNPEKPTIMNLIKAFDRVIKIMEQE